MWFARYESGSGLVSGYRVWGGKCSVKRSRNPEGRMVFLVEFLGWTKKFPSRAPAGWNGFRNARGLIGRVNWINVELSYLEPYVMSWRVWSHGFGFCGVDWLHCVQKLSPRMLVVLGWPVTLLLHCIASRICCLLHSLPCYITWISGSFKFMEFLETAPCNRTWLLLPPYNALLNSVPLN